MLALPPDPHPDIDDYLGRLIAAKQRAPGNDLISAVIRAEADDLVVDDLVSALRWVMVGGHRAPSTLLANGVAALLREPEQWRELCDHPRLIESAVEELLRYVTPFPIGIARTAAAPMAIGPVTIPAGALVTASLVAANHDPARFVDPDALDVTRAENPHLAFGHGHHYCIGAALARRQLQIAIGALTHRFPQLRLAGEARDLHYRQNRVRYLLELPVVAGPDGSRPATASVT
jgi:cytochrome P450